MKTLANAFGVVGLLVLGYWGAAYVQARWYQTRELRHFSEYRTEPQPAAGTPSSSQMPTAAKGQRSGTGSAVAMLVIPRLGLSTVVVEGAEERELKLGPGHIRGTSMPGGGGNVGVAGHRDTFFRPLRLIRRNDTIKVITHERAYRYTVVSTRIVTPDDIRVLYPVEHETLTLVTCYPFDFVGPAPKRFIVRADCVDCARPSEPEPRR